MRHASNLKSVNGYASSLKACTHLYDDGVKIFITLAKLKTAIKNNPQGIVASMSMNNLYIETATELPRQLRKTRPAVWAMTAIRPAPASSRIFCLKWRRTAALRTPMP